jgi:hypothetical protein
MREDSCAVFVIATQLLFAVLLPQGNFDCKLICQGVCIIIAREELCCRL